MPLYRKRNRTTKHRSPRNNPLTRAKSLVVLVGTEEVIRRMVENDHVARRYTTLALRLKEQAL